MDDLLRLAQEHLRAKRFDAAKGAAEEALRADPNAAEALIALAEAEAGLGNRTAAVAAAARASALSPQNTAHLYKLATLQRGAGDEDAALASFARLETMRPNEALLEFECALTHYQRAEHAFEGRAVIDAERVKADLSASKSRCERALAIKPGVAVAQRGIVLAQIGLNDIYQACLEGMKYIGMQPNDPHFPDNFKDVQLRLGLEKILKSPAGAPNLPPERPSALPPGRRRDAWEDAAVAHIKAAIPAALSGPAAVFFHVELDDNHPFLGGARGAKVDYLATLAMSCRCARLTQPGIKIILISDLETKLEGFTGADVLIRLPREANHLMYARLRALQALAMSGRLQGPALFLDTDICLNRDFAPLLDGSFDIGLTYRSAISFPLMPINEGVIVSSGARPAALAEFFGTCLDLYDWLAQLAHVRERYGFDVRFWRGGQLSLNAFAGWRVPPLEPETATLHGLRCRFLHCESYNYSVPANSALAGLEERWALHFKGLLPKALMNTYLQQIERRAAR